MGIYIGEVGNEDYRVTFQDLSIGWMPWDNRWCRHLNGSHQKFMEARGILFMIATINESGRRVAAIVDNMLSFARKSDARVSSHDLSELLNKSLEPAATWSRSSM